MKAHPRLWSCFRAPCKGLENPLLLQLITRAFCPKSARYGPSRSLHTLASIFLIHGYTHKFNTSLSGYFSCHADLLTYKIRDPVASHKFHKFNSSSWLPSSNFGHIQCPLKFRSLITREFAWQDQHCSIGVYTVGQQISIQLLSWVIDPGLVSHSERVLRRCANIAPVGRIWD
ncbi:hypothetical protein BJX63DRAFT_237971 [Aspergillus granulosus]|uniref:Uncharacterized protein n=1 Tax=Aspergillus granulosus TaxID=176169 RepID=A0ABR4HB67_9EURO